jgi:hypothetical protein
VAWVVSGRLYIILGETPNKTRTIAQPALTAKVSKKLTLLSDQSFSLGPPNVFASRYFVKYFALLVNLRLNPILLGLDWLFRFLGKQRTGVDRWYEGF